MGTEFLCRVRLSYPSPEWPAQVLGNELQAHLSCSALDPGAGICELHVSSVSWLPVRLQGRTQRRESLKGREKVPSCSFLFASVLSVPLWWLPFILASAVGPGFQLLGAPPAAASQQLLLRDLGSTLEPSSSEPLDLIKYSFLPLSPSLQGEQRQ